MAGLGELEKPAACRRRIIIFQTLDDRDLVVPTTCTSIKKVNKHVEDVMSKGKQRQEYQKVYYIEIVRYMAYNTAIDCIDFVRSLYNL